MSPVVLDAALRSAGFAALWWVLNQGDVDSWQLGVPAVRWCCWSVFRCSGSCVCAVDRLLVGGALLALTVALLTMIAV